MILLILAFFVAKITGVSHRLLTLLNPFIRKDPSPETNGFDDNKELQSPSQSTFVFSYT
jgi:hypothetical protein